MRFTLILSAVAAFASYGAAAGFNGQLDVSEPFELGEEVYQNIYLTDNTTGAAFAGALVDGFNNECISTGCSVLFAAFKPVGNSATFLADLWLSENTCYNIEFDGQWYSGQEYCCGSLPCDLKA
ncbi:hypothetical protein PMG11_01198 [Penicillium brasilianum]|uniref:Uncharacterized protein n=1 Tax=Penicillium brasilianum TaxID=104259 RepID=A0A0F7THC4_PENBI|nr:hypothetical protein PMG11_01198 [Penicillium brasilianum]